MREDGLITVLSAHSVAETMARLESALRDKGVAIFARIDHGAGATAVSLPLRPTELLIFGNAKAGTPLMQVSQIIGIDLPLKALAWEDGKGKVWLSYNDPAWLVRRHKIGSAVESAVKAMSEMLEAMTRVATT